MCVYMMPCVHLLYGSEGICDTTRMIQSSWWRSSATYIPSYTVLLVLCYDEQQNKCQSVACVQKGLAARMCFLHAGGHRTVNARSMYVGGQNK